MTTLELDLNVFADQRPDGYWETLKRRRDAGIALLNGDQAGWLDRMNTTGLDVADPFSCVMGQAFIQRNFGGGPLESGYSVGYDHYSEVMQGFDATEHGFVSSEDWWTEDDNTIGSEQEYEDLTRVWVEAIDALRAGTYYPGM